MEFGAAGTVMQTKVTDAHKTIWEDVRKETADELEDRQGHCLFFAIIAVIEIFEGDGIIGNGDNPMIGNGNAEDVASEILNQLFCVIERLLNIDFPIFGQGFAQHRLNIKRAVVGVEFAVGPEFGEFKAKTIAEQIGKQEDGKEKLMRSRIPRIARGGGDKRAARDDEVEM